MRDTTIRTKLSNAHRAAIPAAPLIAAGTAVAAGLNWAVHGPVAALVVGTVALVSGIATDRWCRR